MSTENARAQKSEPTDDESHRPTAPHFAEEIARVAPYANNDSPWA